jgi:hypothetical protein
MREGNARMQAMQHAVEKQPHHMGPETILEDNEDESSDEEDALQNVLAAAGATAADRVGAASRGMENFIRSTRDLAQGVSALSLEPALSVRYATQLSQLADEGYDNEEVLLLLPHSPLPPANPPLAPPRHHLSIPCLHVVVTCTCCGHVALPILVHVSAYLFLYMLPILIHVSLPIPCSSVVLWYLLVFSCELM